jgi:hypothetical protein
MEVLAQRVLPYERLQLGDEARVPALLELAVDPRLDSGQAQSLEAFDLGLRERLVRQLRKRGPAPEREGFGELGQVPGRDGVLEVLAVELAFLDPEHVAGWAGLEPVAELLPEERDVVPHDLGRRRRR